MKVLSLTEPFATLILEKKKFVETRSWKTNYRGPLYIHASMTKVLKENLEDVELMGLVENKTLNFGYIVCKCNLVDCVFMTEEYVRDMKKNHQEYICGEYRVGRYAWILEDIEPLPERIKAKGQLNIWNYYNEFEIMDFMDEIEYGWVDKNNHFYFSINEEFSKNYILQSPKQILKNKVGVCWDQVELERYYFQGNDWNMKTYFMVYYDNHKCPTHTFLTFKKNDKYYWFEHSWERFRGIHEYSSEKELLLDVKNIFIQYDLQNQCKKEDVFIHEYKKPKYHLSCQEFYRHCDEGKFIDVDRW